MNLKYKKLCFKIAQHSVGMADIDVDRYQGPLREATPNGHVGFDSLPDQVVNKGKRGTIDILRK